MNPDDELAEWERALLATEPTIGDKVRSLGTENPKPTGDPTTLQVLNLVQRMYDWKALTPVSTARELVAEAIPLIQAVDRMRLEIEEDRQERLTTISEKHAAMVEQMNIVRRCKEQIMERDSYIAELQEEIEFLRSRS